MELTRYQSLLIDFGLRVVYALVIFLIGRWLAGLVSLITQRSMLKAKVHEMLVSFTRTCVYYSLLIFTVLAALGQLGIQTTSFIALIGAAGLAVGLAFQNSLSNFASGVLLIFFHPFSLGDTIEAAGSTGKVTEIQIFNTVIKDVDGKTVIIPNSLITGAKIVIHKKVGDRPSSL